MHSHMQIFRDKTPIAALFVLPFVAMLMASPPLLIGTFDEWREIYAAGVGVCTLVVFILSASSLLLRGMGQALGLLMLLVVPPVFSLIQENPDDWLALANLVVLACYVVLGQGLISQPQTSRFQVLLWSVALSQMVAIVMVLSIASVSSDWSSWLRENREAFNFESAQLHPNVVGLMAVVMASAAATMPERTAKWVIMVLAAIACWLVSSRNGQLVVLAAFALAAIARRLSQGWKISQRDKKLALAVALISLPLMWKFGGAISQFIMDDVLLLNDQYRGLDTGFSERTDLWAIAYDLWLERPLFGVGYGQGADAMGSGMYAHNLVLVLLSETGLVGLAAFVIFSLICIRNGIRTLRNGHVLAGTLIIVMMGVYWLYGLFEGRAINVGNPLSSLFFLVCFASPSLAASPRRSDRNEPFRALSV